MVLKVAATDPVSRQTGLALGLYEREVRFYTEIAPDLGGPVAPCYHAGFDAAPARFICCSATRGPPSSATKSVARQSNRPAWRWPSWAGCTLPLLGDTAMAEADWLNRESPMNQALIGQLYAGFVERYRDQIAPEHRDVCERLVGALRRLRRRRGRPRSRAGSRPRRLPARQHAVRRARRRPAADGRRLADRHVGSGDDRRRVLPRLRAARRHFAATTTTSCCAPTTTRSARRAGSASTTCATACAGRASSA